MKKNTYKDFRSKYCNFGVDSPGSHSNGFFETWQIDRLELPNRTALAIARFIARWNGYELVKKKEK